MSRPEGGEKVSHFQECPRHQEHSRGTDLGQKPERRSVAGELRKDEASEVCKEGVRVRRVGPDAPGPGFCSE